jgi:hypothetical protein
MSLNFYYETLPNIEEEGFRLLNVYDAKISQTDWNVIRAEISSAVVGSQGRSNSIATKLRALRKHAMAVRKALGEL